MSFWRQFFTWWNGQTLGTRFFTWRKGVFVGADEFGNKYYTAPSALPESIPVRRWVIYSNYAEASAIPPGWHAWMHHRAEGPPSANYVAREWEKPHRQNQTGTAEAYRPSGSILQASPQPMALGYEAWKPDEPMTGGRR
ncbi:MAG: NADH:ubiquinone oxidoreductase subunit NDUFA12 [Pseudomonadota bacterium]|nr:NADH:ubiquinone oxidoreductase subunit NDUFA12 [Pseudomonadota bacterium]